MDYSNFKLFVESYTEGFDFGDEANENFLQNIVNYFTEGETTLDKNKGLLIRGSIGVGKTSTLKLIQTWLPAERKFMYNPANELVSLFNADGEGALNVFKKTKIRLFDDIGAEDTGKHYGSRVEVIQKLIYSRYDLFRSNGIKTHFTTNLDNDIIEEIYGSRAYDRIKEMCSLVNWNTTESKRGKVDFRRRQLDDLPKILTKQEKIEIMRLNINLVIEIYERKNGYFELKDQNDINPIYDTLKKYGYNLGDNKFLITLYNDHRVIELKKKGKWFSSGERRRAFKDYADPKFMAKNKSAMMRNAVHREVSLRCRKIVIEKFYDECKEMYFDLSIDIMDRFNKKNTL